MKNLILIIVLLFSLTMGVFAQKGLNITMFSSKFSNQLLSSESINSVNRAFPSIGMEGRSIASYIGAKTTYPELAKTYGIEGFTMVRLEISREAEIKKITFTKPIHHLLKAEILEVIQNIDQINPALLDGTAISSVVYVPFNFFLE